MATKKASKKVVKKKKKSNPYIAAVIKLLSLVLAVVLMILAALFVVNLYKLGLLPQKYLIPISIIIVVLALLLAIVSIFKAKRKVPRNICFILLLCFCVGYYTGNRYVVNTSKMFDNITNLTDQVSNTVCLRAMNGNGYTEIKNFEGKNVGYVPSSDQVGTERAIQEIADSGVNVNLQEYGDIVTMMNALFDNGIEGVIISDSLLGTLPDIDEKFTLVTTLTNVVHKTVYYTERDKSTQTEPESASVDKETFTVLISGNDNYGGLTQNSRSDVNMLVTVNPKTGVVLMTSIPRDYYVEVNCQSEDVCSLGEMDKLTHTGINGIATTEQTLEKLFNIKVNYNVVANFSSLVNFVDAVGGIDIYVEEGMAVKQFFSNNMLQGVDEGWNHLDGERALAYARERHAYSTGDNQRVLNQQQVLSALINKVCSPSILLHYDNLIDAVGGAFQTNMPAEDMQKLMKYELSSMPEWKFESYQLQGYGDYQYCAALGSTAYVTVPYPESVDAGIKKIQAVYDGKSSTKIADPYAELSQNVYAVDTTEEIRQAIEANGESNAVEEYGYY